MVQAGGYTFTLGEKSTRPPIPLEANNGLTNDRGTIAMARTGNPNSATAQFFVNVKDNASLNAKGNADGYAVFGKVISGMDVIDKIKAVPTGSKGILSIRRAPHPRPYYLRHTGQINHEQSQS